MTEQKRITGTVYTSRYLTTEQIKNYLIDVTGYSEKDLENDEELTAITKDLSDEQVMDMEAYNGLI